MSVDEWLPVVWFGVIGFGVLMYVLLDGFVLDFEGFTYTLASADAAPLAWFAAGSFLGIDYMDLIGTQAGSALGELHQRLKTALDPNIVISPGRYVGGVA